MEFREALNKVKAKALTVNNLCEMPGGRWRANVCYWWRDFFEFACGDTPEEALSKAADVAKDFSAEEAQRLTKLLQSTDHRITEDERENIAKRLGFGSAAEADKALGIEEQKSEQDELAKILGADPEEVTTDDNGDDLNAIL